MKSTHQVERFDYSKILARDDMRYFGIHPKSGRIHIDTKRYKKVLEEDGVDEFLPQGLFVDRNTVYFVPALKKRHDYKFNIFRDLINDLHSEWEEEYKPLFKYIKTPTEVYDNTRLEGIAISSCADDLEDIELDAMLDSIRRTNSYYHVVQSLYCTFISKLSTEIDRIILNVLIELGYKSSDFNYTSFIKFSDGLQKNKQGKKIEQLDKYHAFNLLHKLNNFLKHNTIRSYEELKRRYPNNVASIENHTADVAYENGMYAVDWIIVKDNYIDELFDKLIVFFKDYCREYLHEDVDNADWNYDDYFKNAYKKMKDLNIYWGLYYEY